VALLARVTVARGKRRHSGTVTIATARFSIAPGSTASVAIQLAAVGRSMLRAARGRLRATLKLLTESPAPAGSRTDSVRLSQRAARR
jgi:hypothetical protein